MPGKDYNAISLTDFSFVKDSCGHFFVRFTSRNTRKSWVALVTDMTMIDSTRNSEDPRRADLVRLRRHCKMFGNCYDRRGNIIHRAE